jgi:hypothetical protein
MLTHIMHGAYEFVEKVADEAPGPNPEVGQVSVWIGGASGAMSLRRTWSMSSARRRRKP